MTSSKLKLVIDVKDTLASPLLVTAGIRGLEKAGVGLDGIGAFQAYKALQAAQFGPINEVIRPYIFRFLPSDVERLCKLYKTSQEPDNELLVKFIADASDKTIGVRLRSYMDTRSQLDVELLKRCKKELNFNLTVWDIEKDMNFVDTEHAVKVVNEDDLLDGFAIGGPSDRWPDYEATLTLGKAPLFDIFSGAKGGAVDLALGSIMGDVFESDVGFYSANGDVRGTNPFNVNFRLIYYMGVDDVGVTIMSKMEMAKYIWRAQTMTDVCLTLVPLFDTSRIFDGNIPPSMAAFERIVCIFADPQSGNGTAAPSTTFGCMHPVSYKSLRSEVTELLRKGLVPEKQRDIVTRFINRPKGGSTDCWAAVKDPTGAPCSVGAV